MGRLAVLLLLLPDPFFPLYALPWAWEGDPLQITPGVPLPVGFQVGLAGRS